MLRYQDLTASNYHAVSRGKEVESQLLTNQINANDHSHVHLGDVVHNHFGNTKAIALSFESVSLADSKIIDTDIKTLTVNFLASVTEVLELLRSCQNHARRLKMADLSVASLHTLCLTICFKLKHIQGAIASIGKSLVEEVYEPYVLEEYEHVVQTCRLPFTSLKSRLIVIQPSQHPDPFEFKEVLRNFGDDSKVKVIVDYLQTRARAIDLISSAFQSESQGLAKINAEKEETQSILESLDNDAISFHSSFDNPTQQNTQSSPRTSRVFGFDAELAASPIYRRQYLRSLIQKYKTDHTNYPSEGLSVPFNTTERNAIGNYGQGIYGMIDCDVQGRDLLPFGVNDRPHPHSEASNDEDSRCKVGSNLHVADVQPLEAPDGEEIAHIDADHILPLLYLGSRSPYSHKDEIFIDSALAGLSTDLETFGLDKANDGGYNNLNSLEHPIGSADTQLVNLKLHHENQRHQNATILLKPQLTNESSDMDSLHVMLQHVGASTRDQSRRHSMDSTSSSDTVRDVPRDEANLHRLAHHHDYGTPDPELYDHYSAMVASLRTSSSDLADPLDESDMIELEHKETKLPTLREVLTRRTVKPYGLFEFYLYMRDHQRSVDYLDFWLDIVQHRVLCRRHVRDLELEISDEIAATTGSTTAHQGSKEMQNVAGSSKTSPARSVVTLADLGASAEKILYTFILPGSEREIILPQSLTNELVDRIERQRRIDYDIFSSAQDWVYRAMELDAFPHFLQFSRPRYKLLRTTLLGRGMAYSLSRPKSAFNS